jgi:hypothetical protein
MFNQISNINMKYLGEAARGKREEAGREQRAESREPARRREQH